MNILERLQGGDRVSTRSAAEMERLGEEWARGLPPDVTVALSGDLGSGKTTFVRGMARAWGIGEAVTSPTYTIYTLYEGGRQLVHVDAYRLEGIPRAFEDLMLEEFMRSPFAVAIEWPERIAEAIPDDAVWLDFEIDEANSHTVTMRRIGGREGVAGSGVEPD